MADAQLAAICRNWSAGLATRNDDFIDTGVDAINPWDSATPYCPARERPLLRPLNHWGAVENELT